MAKTIRLLRVVVQPVLVLDDGTTLEEVQHPPITITPDKWPDYSAKTFPAELAQFQKELDAEANAQLPIGAPRRRRAKS
jgi:hypothetical protein